jgi:hypothetical protein
MRQEFGKWFLVENKDKKHRFSYSFLTFLQVNKSTSEVKMFKGLFDQCWRITG